MQSIRDENSWIVPLRSPQATVEAEASRATFLAQIAMRTRGTGFALNILFLRRFKNIFRTLFSLGISMNGLDAWTARCQVEQQRISVRARLMRGPVFFT